MPDINIVDTKNIINAVRLKYNIDLSVYPLGLLRYKIDGFLRKHRLKYADILITRLIEDPKLFLDFRIELQQMDFELFRDPEFWKVLNKKILPLHFRKFNHLQILLPACYSGFELYSILILLEEYGQHEKADITISYDFEESVSKILDGRNTIKLRNIGIENFKKLYPDVPFEKYFEQKENFYLFRMERLTGVKRINHAEWMKEPVRKFNLVLFRDKLIHMTRNAQEKMIDILAKSIMQEGILVFGYRENPEISLSFSTNFSDFDKENRIYRRI